MASSSISAGILLYNILNSNATLSKLVSKIFPIVVNTATLPYIAYRRASIQRLPVKGGGADTVSMEISCYAASYADSVDLAELVRELLDGMQAAKSTPTGDLVLRSCTLVDGSESYEGDAFCQTLIFEMKLNNQNS